MGTTCVPELNSLTLMNSISSANNIRLSDLKTMFRLCRNDRTNTCWCYWWIAAGVRTKSCHPLALLWSADRLFRGAQSQE